MEIRNVCIFGASNEGIPSCYIELAEELGERLANEDIGLVFGAGRTGLMGAAARGAHKADGRLIGVIPKKLNVPGIYYEYCTERIETPTMHERKALMEEKSDAFVALSGGFGTIEELMEVITLKQLGYHRKPIVIFNKNGYYDHLIAQFERCVDEGFTNAMFLKLYTVTDTVEGVIADLRDDTELPMPDKMKEVLLRSRFAGDPPPGTENI